MLRACSGTGAQVCGPQPPACSGFRGLLAGCAARGASARHELHGGGSQGSAISRGQQVSDCFRGLLAGCAARGASARHELHGGGSQGSAVSTGQQLGHSEDVGCISCVPENLALAHV
eukprot:scaffold166054_cov18-Tisochrysis_lutea.AAC.1